MDSSYLLYAAKCKAGADVQSVLHARPAFQPEFELEDAKRLCAQLGVQSCISFELDALANPDVVTANPANRCYYCKTALFGTLQARAKADGYTVLLDGTNASDDAGDRPGMKALTEMSVLSPLRLCGLTQSADPGALPRGRAFYVGQARLRLSCHPHPDRGGHHGRGAASARGAARRQVLFSLGFTDFRVRVFHDAARVQFRSPAQMQQALSRRSEILKNVKALF